MLKAKSRDGVYIISAPDNAKTIPAENCNNTEAEYDNVQDVYLEVVEGRKGNLLNLARAIAYDCFSTDSLGLHLLAEKLRCHVTAGDNKYEFEILKSNRMELYMKYIAEQTEL